MNSLTTEVGQMILIGIHDPNDTQELAELETCIREGKVGGLLLYEKNLPSSSTVSVLKEQIETFQSWAPVPLLICIDEEGGQVHRFNPSKGYSPSLSAATLGELNDDTKTQLNTQVMAEMLSLVGVNVNFAPCVDLNLNPNNPIIGAKERSYSASPSTVSRHAKTVIDVLNDRGIAATLKHFPGHGSSSEDTHLNLTDITTTWQEEELLPYQALLRNTPLLAVMTAHIVHRNLDPTGLPATLSKLILQGLLRDKLGFKGTVFSDDMQMGAIRDEYGAEEALFKAIDAGIDMLIYSNFQKFLISPSEIHAQIQRLVQDKKIPEATIKAASGRVLSLKKALGLLP